MGKRKQNVSVVKGKRGKTKLEVIDKAEELAKYSINMVSQEKHFPKRYRWIFASKIGDSAIEVNSLVHKANAIYPKVKVEAQLRIRYVNEAIAEISNLLSLISLCRQAKDVSLENIDHWLTLATYVRTLLLRWKEACHKNYDGLP